MENRVIKFRAKRLGDGEWVYGYYYVAYTHASGLGHWIASIDESRGIRTWAIDPATVGQFTGLLDKNGKEIYDGDKFKSGSSILEVVWSNHHQWGAKVIKGGALTEGLTFPLWQYDKRISPGVEIEITLEESPISRGKELKGE